MVRETPPAQGRGSGEPSYSSGFAFAWPFSGCSCHLNKLDVLAASKDPFSAWLLGCRSFTPSGWASALFDLSLQHLLAQVPLTGMLIFFSGVPSPAGSLTPTPAQPSLSQTLGPEQSKYFLLSPAARPGRHILPQPSSAARSPIFSSPWFRPWAPGKELALSIPVCPSKSGHMLVSQWDLEKEPVSSWPDFQSLLCHF